MGKYDNRNKLIESGRLTGFKAMATSGNRFDARQKLVQKSLSTSSARNSAKFSSAGFISKQNLKQQKIDARQLLLNKQQKQIQKEKIKQILLDKHNRQKYVDEVEEDGDDIIFTKNNARKKTKNEPLVIVTGLGNVRKQGDRIKVIGNNKPSSNNSNSNHKVIVDGVNTLVTLRNKTSSSNRFKDDIGDYEDDDDDAVDIDKTNNFKQIRIRIDNDLKPASSSNLNYTNSISSKHKSSNEMEWNDDNQNSNSSSQLSSKFNSRGNSTNNGDYGKTGINVFGNNGYKLLVSNLHPRVTEDDVLELFSDIGPIKRARFLEKGVAEVVYVKLEHAEEAIYKYNRNELDGRPMKIELAEKYESKSLFSQLQSVSNIQSSHSSTNFNASSSLPYKSNIGSSSSNTHNISSSSSSSRSNYLSQQPQQLLSSASSSMSSMSFYKAKADLAEEANYQSSAKNTLSNRFKSATNTSTFSLPEPMSTTYGKKGGFDASNKVSAVDTSIIQQVLFNKKGATNSNPVTFTVKL